MVFKSKEIHIMSTEQQDDLSTKRQQILDVIKDWERSDLEECMMEMVTSSPNITSILHDIISR
jgi:hypothetical protein